MSDTQTVFVSQEGGLRQQYGCVSRQKEVTAIGGAAQAIRQPPLLSY
jgi:hypothetical protein